MLSTILLLALAAGVTIKASLSAGLVEKPATCLQGSADIANRACRALSLAYPGQLFLSRGTNRTGYLTEAEGIQLYHTSYLHRRK